MLYITYIHLLLILPIYNVSQVEVTTKEYFVSTHLNKFVNTAYITSDSCKKWGFPDTQFKIEYPNDFIIEYNADSKYYLRLRKFTNNKVSKEITIGKSGVVNKEGAEFWLKTINKGLASQFENYQLLFLGEKEFIDSTYYLLQCQINFDHLEDSRFIGNYFSSIVIFLPPNDKVHGVSINMLCDNTLTGSNEEIMKTFNFLY